MLISKKWVVREQDPRSWRNNTDIAYAISDDICLIIRQDLMLFLVIVVERGAVAEV